MCFQHKHVRGYMLIAYWRRVSIPPALGHEARAFPNPAVGIESPRTGADMPCWTLTQRGPGGHCSVSLCSRQHEGCRLRSPTATAPGTQAAFGHCDSLVSRWSGQACGQYSRGERTGVCVSEGGVEGPTPMGTLSFSTAASGPRVPWAQGHQPGDGDGAVHRQPPQFF